MRAKRDALLQINHRLLMWQLVTPAPPPPGQAVFTYLGWAQVIKASKEAALLRLLD